MKKADNDAWCIPCGPLQTMRSLDEFEEEEKDEDKGTISNSIDISGTWVPKGDVEINKVDSQNTNTKLKNVEFIVYQGTDSNANKYMKLSKNGTKINQIIGTEIT